MQKEQQCSARVEFHGKLDTDNRQSTVKKEKTKTGIDLNSWAGN